MARYPFPQDLGLDPNAERLGEQAAALEEKAGERSGPAQPVGDTLWAAAGTYRLAEQIALLRKTLEGLAPRSVSEALFGRNR